jgi:putative FmdB family regulatory protein
MPVYEYECKACHRTFEYQQRMSDPDKTECEACGGELERLISRTAFQLKGGGWYKDLYSSTKPSDSTPSASSSAPKASDSASSSSDSTSSSGSSSGSSGSSSGSSTSGSGSGSSSSGGSTTGGGSSTAAGRVA